MTMRGKGATFTTAFVCIKQSLQTMVVSSDVLLFAFGVYMLIHRFILVCALLLLVMSPRATSQENTSYLSDPNHIFWHDNNTLSEITLNFDDAAWQTLLTSSQSNREEVSASMTYLNYGTEYSLSNIGVKLSGNTSFVLPINSAGNLAQANFTLDFDEFVDDQSLKGIAALKLKRYHNDPTFVRENLSNRIMQAFDIFTAHSSTPVKVYLQLAGQSKKYLGIYRLNESVNRHEYLDKRFAGNDGGFLWQGNYKAYGPALFSRITQDWEGVADADDASFEYKSKGSKFPEAKEQLVRLATNLSTLEGDAFKDYAERHINMPLFLKFLAAEAVLGHWDGFWGNANNYLFYVDENEVIHFIPYDTDNTLGTSGIVSDSGEQIPAQFGASDNTPQLVSKILSINNYLGEFLRNTQTLVEQAGLMTESESIAYINQVHSNIENSLQNDTNENDEIADRPAYWGNQPNYRLFTTTNGKNWYATRKAAVIDSLGLPIAAAGSDMSGEVGSTITLNAGGSRDDDGSIVSYEWSNGLSGIRPEITLDTVGTTTLTLTVTDNFGFSASSSINITTTAAAANPAPAPTPAPEPQSSGGGSLAWFSLLILVTFTLRTKKRRIMQHYT